MKKVQQGFVFRENTPLYSTEYSLIHFGDNYKTANKRFHQFLKKCDSLAKKYPKVEFFPEAQDDDVSEDPSCEYTKGISDPWYSDELHMESEDEALLEKAVIEMLEYLKNTVKVKFAYTDIIKRHKDYHI
jgi:hypothetical protein